MELQQINIKVTIIGDKFSFSFDEDYTEYAHDLIKYGNVFTNTNELMTYNNILEYFKDGEFSDKDVKELNGSHFIYEFLEALGQSERCPDILYSYVGNLKYKTELIE